MFAHAANETGNFTSDWWNDELNPAGIGIMDGGVLERRVYASGTEAARAQIYHTYLYVFGTPPLGHAIHGWRDLDPRAWAVESYGLTRSAVTIDDLQGKWWTSPTGLAGVYSKYDAVFSAASNGSSPPSTSALPINSERLLTSGPNYPGQNLNDGDLWITIHETGNSSTGAGAKMHHTYVLNGGGPSRVCFHLTVDDHIAYQIMQLDKVGWHASDGCDNRNTDLGCFASVAIETCINRDGNWTQTVDNLIELIVAIIRGDSRLKYGTAKGRFSADRIATHNKWAFDRKWCPTNILNQGLLPYIIGEVKRRLANTGPNPPQPGEPEPVYAKASIPAFLRDADTVESGKDQMIGSTKIYACRREYRARTRTKRLRHTGDDAPEVGPPINRDERFVGLYRYRSNNKWWVLTGYGTRIQASHLDPYVSIRETP